MADPFRYKPANAPEAQLARQQAVEGAGRPKLSAFQARVGEEIRANFPAFRKPGFVPTDDAMMKAILDLPSVKGNVAKFIKEVFIQDKSGTDFEPTATAYGEMAFALGKAAAGGDAAATKVYQELLKAASEAEGDDPRNPVMAQRLEAAFAAGQAGQPVEPAPELPRGR